MAVTAADNTNNTEDNLIVSFMRHFNEFSTVTFAQCRLYHDKYRIDCDKLTAPELIGFEKFGCYLDKYIQYTELQIFY